VNGGSLMAMVPLQLGPPRGVRFGLLAFSLERDNSQQVLRRRNANKPNPDTLLVFTPF